MDRMPDTPDEAEDRGLDSNPGSPGSYSSQASTPHETAEEQNNPKRLPSLRSVSDPQNMNPNSTPLGTLSNARRPPAPGPSSSSSVATGGALSNSDAMLKARALAANRMGMSPASSNSPAGGGSPGRSSPVGGGLAGGMRLPPGAVAGRPGLQNTASAPSLPKPGLSARRKMNLNINDISGHPGAGPQSNGEGAGQPANPVKANGSANISQMDEFKKYIDAEKGWLTFEGAATLTNRGVDFKGGHSFRMSLEDVVQLEELGKGNYGTVYKVQHAPSIRFKDGPSTVSRPPQGAEAPGPGGGGAGTFTGKVMAMKQIRLELDEARLTTILKELVILHECVSPYIIDFYGAFFQEGAVYMCIEYMDGGSVDKLYAGGVPEDVLRRIAHATIRGLKVLKEEHNIIHRDVKPTNILVNQRGKVKICDFGVSGNLVASIAKTNIGCQSYMAPERISGVEVGSGGNSDGSYSVQSDIWSLGLTVIECALGEYPYPPEVASTIFSQLNAIVEGDPPDMPSEGYSQTAREFVRGCLNKTPKLRPTYDALLRHAWLKPVVSKCDAIEEEPEEDDGTGEQGQGQGQNGVEEAAEGLRALELDPEVHDAVVAEWVMGALERKERADGEKGKDKGNEARPALHAAPLDQVPSPGIGPLGVP